MNWETTGALAERIPDTSSFEPQVLCLEDPPPAVVAASATACSDYCLRIAVVYQGTAAWDWASQTTARAGGLVGNRCVESVWWDIAEANDGAAQAASEAAALADIVIVAIGDVDDLPGSIYGWLFGLLASRQMREGLLLALLGTSEERAVDSIALERYLAALARTAKMDFLVLHPPLPTGALSLPLRPSIGYPAIKFELNSRLYAAEHPTQLRHWGINE